MKYINDKFYIEVNNPKYIINDRTILRETTVPKSSKTKFEILRDVKPEKILKMIEFDDGTLQIIELKK